MIEQALLNLCLNARDAMPEGGRLTIATAPFTADDAFCESHSWERPGEYARIDIRDTGTGIAEEVREQIFNPFFTTKDLDKGTGLGHSMAYGIVRQHRGYITVDSEPGAGTTFELFLPVTGEQAVLSREQTPAPSGGGGETILVAENTAELLELTVQMLEHKGYTVVPARDGMEAFDAFTRLGDKIDLVLLDVIMPNMSGREAYDFIKQIHPDLPVLFTSGYTANSLGEDFLAREKVQLLQKPYDAEELFAAIRNAIDPP